MYIIYKYYDMLWKNEKDVKIFYNLKLIWSPQKMQYFIKLPNMANHAV